MVTRTVKMPKSSRPGLETSIIQRELVVMNAEMLKDECSGRIDVIKRVVATEKGLGRELRARCPTPASTKDSQQQELDQLLLSSINHSDLSQHQSRYQLRSALISARPLDNNELDILVPPSSPLLTLFSRRVFWTRRWPTLPRLELEMIDHILASFRPLSH